MKHTQCEGCGAILVSGRLSFLYQGYIVCWKCKWHLIKKEGLTESVFKQVKGDRV